MTNAADENQIIAYSRASSNPDGSTNIDLTVSSDGKFLYSLNVGIGSIGIFAINENGTLTSVGSVAGVLAAQGFNGIAAL